jgi:hypothetical protein
MIFNDQERHHALTIPRWPHRSTIGGQTEGGVPTLGRRIEGIFRRSGDSRTRV